MASNRRNTGHYTYNSTANPGATPTGNGESIATFTNSVNYSTDLSGLETDLQQAQRRA